MSEHEKQTAFLRRCLVYDKSVEHQELEEGIAQILRDERCLRRAMWLMALLMTLVLVGLGYTVVLLDDFLYKLPLFLIKLISALGLASLLSLLAFAGLHVIYRHQLNGRREKCRQLATKLLESRPDNHRPRPLRGVLKETGAVENSSEAVE